MACILEMNVKLEDGPDEILRIAEIFSQNEQNRRAYMFLKGLFGRDVSLDILDNVSKNIKLFRLFQTSECEKFTNIDGALTALRRDEDAAQKVLIHFAELNLYGMFTPEQYTTLTNNLADKVIDGVNISFRPKQIILTGLPQKLVFICLGDENIVEKIRKYVDQKYKCGITSVKTDIRTEITVQRVGGSNYEEAQSCYQDLFDFISEKNRDHEVANTILPMPIIKRNNHSYMLADMSYDVSKPQDIKDIISALKTIHSGNIIINMGVIVEGNISGGNVGCTQNITDDSKPTIKTLKWIRENLPHEKEITTDYYNRYAANHDGAKISINHFGKIVRSLGYKPVQGTSHRFWVKV